MDTILGFAMIYAWIHGVVIIFKKITGLTDYEKVVLWFGFVFTTLFIIGSIN